MEEGTEVDDVCEYDDAADESPVPSVAIEADDSVRVCNAGALIFLLGRVEDVMVGDLKKLRELEEVTDVLVTFDVVLADDSARLRPVLKPGNEPELSFVLVISVGIGKEAVRTSVSSAIGSIIPLDIADWGAGKTALDGFI